jgi:hypothetical protein
VKGKTDYLEQRDHSSKWRVRLPIPELLRPYIQSFAGPGGQRFYRVVEIPDPPIYNDSGKCLNREAFLIRSCETADYTVALGLAPLTQTISRHRSRRCG